MLRSTKLFIFLCAACILPAGCNDEGIDNSNKDGFNRQELLRTWADSLILPGYTNYLQTLLDLKQSATDFIDKPDTSALRKLRSSWLNSYIAWQYVALYEIGKAESVSLRDFTNTYPTSPANIEKYLANGAPNLELPSTRSEQGFPALDYLINGSAGSDTGIVNRYISEDGLGAYTALLIDRLIDLTTQVRDHWDNGYRNQFMENSGSSASSSVNKIVNDYMFYYERSLRAAKVGIPAGVFSSMPLSDRVEAYYHPAASRTLFMHALQNCIYFFNGTRSVESSAGLAAYLDHLQTIQGGEQLSLLINHQFVVITEKALLLRESFKEQVEKDNQGMLVLFDALQENVVLLKVDMMQALNIKVDFVDADGD
ncbi:MAG: imelysin family protein [Flavobacteriales bacterium]|nr:imelysin family protein [Flavobacteriales bacterium]